MRLDVIEAISAPGKPSTPNEDAHSAAPGLAAVVDGATGLCGKLLNAPSDAAWLAQRGAEGLAHHAGAHQGRELLRAVLGDIEAGFVAERIKAPAELYELPMASLMLLQALAPATLAAHWFGDCGALIARPDGAVQVIGGGFDQKAQEAERAARLAAASGQGPAERLDQPEVLAALRAARNRYNSADGPWVFAPDLRCAEHAQSQTIDCPDGSWILLATDGFLALATDYGCYDAPGLVAAARARGLAPLLQELRLIEAGDPQGRRFPRFKQSDDATALLIRTKTG